MKIKTRFAPSSTGFLHLGSMRTALYSWLFAKRFNGSFVLRIEDTDISRSNTVYIKNILSTLKWLGITWDEGPYLQSTRLRFYKKVIHYMLESNLAYKCYCSIDRLNMIRRNQILNGKKPRYDRKCREIFFNNRNNESYVIRFKNPLDGQVIFDDQIRGRIIFNNHELDDLIIQRRNGIPTYNFCVVMDDLDMQITHVIRGEDHINNTPRQINILKSLNANIPIYAHVSMIINHDKTNLSKRKNSESLLDYKKEGILKEAVLNYLLKLGWSHNDQEIFSLEEMKQFFSLKGISKSSSTLNKKKLLWFNHYYLNHLPIDSNLIDNFKKCLHALNISFENGPDLFLIISILRDRCNTLKQMALQSKYFFSDFFDINTNLLRKYSSIHFYNLLSIIYNKLSYFSIWNAKHIMLLVDEISLKYKFSLKDIYVLLRISITGSSVSPSISKVMEIIGQSSSLVRIKNMLFLIQD
ncbi:glutamate--tRNA ligase [Buchnera aphidicola]|uniref:glutamate--tRNA ligase n=1 Tax=Buchnera aphidicola TaxID=9 RepID=UPI00346458CD